MRRSVLYAACGYALAVGLALIALGNAIAEAARRGGLEVPR